MAPSRLIISAIPDDFDPRRDVALGPWCFVGRENQCPDWDRLDFVDPFPTPEDWVEADRLTRRLANQLVPRWADRMNRRHGRNYGLGFWRVFLLNWLAVVIPALWSRFRHVQAVVERHGAQSLCVAVAADWPRWNIANTLDVLPLLWSPEGDEQLSSLAVKALAPPNWRLDVHPSQPKATESGSTRRSRLSGLLHRLTGRLAVNQATGLKWGRLPLSLWATLMPRRAARDHFDFSDSGIFDRFPAAFLDLLDVVLERTLPHGMADGFAELEREALAETYHPGRLLVDAINSEDDRERMIVAMAWQRGERLVGVQHGGTYGTHRAMMHAAETEYRYHGFLTWGWRAQEDCAGCFIPVPSVQLSAIAGRHREAEERLILVGNSMVVHGTRLGWLPKPRHYLSYRRAKLAFLGGLEESVRGRAAYRPYRRNVTVLQDDEFVRDAYPDLPLVEGDLDRALLRCRLAVIDHPITTILTVMAGNVPSIFYWEPDAWPLARQAQPVFDELRRVGILHDSPEAAAAQVNAVWADVAGWWARPEIQAARRRFIRDYARTSRVWWWHWMRALLHLSRR